MADSGLYRPQGCVSADVADMITDTLRYFRARGLRDVLENVTAKTGFESLGLSVSPMVRLAAAGTVEIKRQVAIISRPEHICPEQSDPQMAAEEGPRPYLLR